MKSLLIILALLVTGCASYAPGFDAKRIADNSSLTLSINTEISSDMSYEDYVFINFYFSNKNSEWIRVKNVEILNIENHEDARVIVGKDLYYWTKGMERMISIDAYNRKLLWGSLALAGGAVMATGMSSENKSLVIGGAAIVVGSAVISDVQNVMKKVDDLQRATLVPEEHIYTPFSAPPHLVTSKWFLFQKKSVQDICSITYKLTFTDDSSSIFKSPLSKTTKGCKNGA